MAKWIQISFGGVGILLAMLVLHVNFMRTPESMTEYGAMQKIAKIYKDYEIATKEIPVVKVGTAN